MGILLGVLPYRCTRGARKPDTRSQARGVDVGASAVVL